MNNSCEFAGDRCCLCSACQSMRELMEEAEKITSEKIDEVFQEAEKALEEMKCSK